MSCVNGNCIKMSVDRDEEENKVEDKQQVKDIDIPLFSISHV